MNNTNTANGFGDPDFSRDVRNPRNLVGGVPYETETIPDKFDQIYKQRERIVESFMAEHAGLKASQIRQVVTPLENGDVAWHVEVIE
jgi:hypothetical protein